MTTTGTVSGGLPGKNLVIRCCVVFVRELLCVFVIDARGARRIGSALVSGMRVMYCVTIC